MLKRTANQSLTKKKNTFRQNLLSKHTPHYTIVFQVLHEDNVKTRKLDSRLLWKVSTDLYCTVCLGTKMYFVTADATDRIIPLVSRVSASDGACINHTSICASACDEELKTK